jgi:hypothetical protein
MNHFSLRCVMKSYRERKSYVHRIRHRAFRRYVGLRA